MNVFENTKLCAQKFKPTRLLRDQSGVAAMEFAIIAPLIIGLYLGLAELASYLSVERKISHSASVAGDLATQVSSIDTTDAADLVSAVLHVVNINNPDRFALRIESFERLGDGSIESAGEIFYQSGSGDVPAFDQSSLTTDLLPNRSGIVVASVRYVYKPFGFNYTSGDKKGTGILPNEVNVNETFLLKPRQSSVVNIGNTTPTRISCSGRTNRVNCS